MYMVMSPSYLHIFLVRKTDSGPVAVKGLPGEIERG
jgi:hypothetical protein